MYTDICIHNHTGVRVALSTGEVMNRPSEGESTSPRLPRWSCLRVKFPRVGAWTVHLLEP